AAVLEPVQSRITKAQGHLEFSGNADGVHALRFDLEKANQTDIQEAARFKPVSVTGRASLEGSNMQADLTIGVHDAPFAMVEIRHSISSSKGSADIEIKDATFAAGQLQP